MYESLSIAKHDTHKMSIFWSGTGSWGRERKDPFLLRGNAERYHVTE